MIVKSSQNRIELGTRPDAKQITGMVRVGDLSKGLLLAGQKVVDLVLLIKAPPTIQILNEVETTLKQKFQEKAEKKVSKHIFGNSLTPKI